jgi:hypothetical protein
MENCQERGCKLKRLKIPEDTGSDSNFVDISS